MDMIINSKNITKLIIHKYLLNDKDKYIVFILQVAYHHSTFYNTHIKLSFLKIQFVREQIVVFPHHVWKFIDVTKLKNEEKI